MSLRGVSKGRYLKTCSLFWETHIRSKIGLLMEATARAAETASERHGSGSEECTARVEADVELRQTQGTSGKRTGGEEEEFKRTGECAQEEAEGALRGPRKGGGFGRYAVRGGARKRGCDQLT